MNESAWSRASRDAENVRASWKFFWGAEVFGAAAFGFLGTKMDGDDAIGGFFGVVSGLLAVWGIIFLYQLVQAPYRQRDEARHEAEAVNVSPFVLDATAHEIALPYAFMNEALRSGDTADPDAKLVFTYMGGAGLGKMFVRNVSDRPVRIDQITSVSEFWVRRGDGSMNTTGGIASVWQTPDLSAIPGLKFWSNSGRVPASSNVRRWKDARVPWELLDSPEVVGAGQEIELPDLFVGVRDHRRSSDAEELFAEWRARTGEATFQMTVRSERGIFTLPSASEPLVYPVLIPPPDGSPSDPAEPVDVDEHSHSPG